MQKMTKQEAIEMIDRALSQLETTRAAHIQLQMALEVLVAEIDKNNNGGTKQK